MAQLNNNVNNTDHTNNNKKQTDQQSLQISKLKDSNKSIFVTVENYKTKLIDDNEINNNICPVCLKHHSVLLRS